MKIKKTAIALCAMLMVATAASAKSERVNIEGSRGNLVAVIQTPDNLKSGDKIPMAIIMHGFTGKKESPLLEGIANKLEATGIASIRFDFNGHGESEGDFQYMTVPNEIEDAQKVYDYVSRLSYVSSIALAGHSQGGVVASMLAGQLGADKVKDVVLMAPAGALREDAIRGNTMGKTYDPLDPPEYVEMFGGLKLGKDYITTAFSLPIYETAANYKGKALMIHGTGDRLVPYTYSVLFNHIWPGSELQLLDGFDHGFTQDMDRVVDMASEHIIKTMKQ